MEGAWLAIIVWHLYVYYNLMYHGFGAAGDIFTEVLTIIIVLFDVVISVFCCILGVRVLWMMGVTRTHTSGMW
jgi:hypothetical protein